MYTPAFLAHELVGDPHPSVRVVCSGDKLTLVVDTKAAPAPTATFNLNITKQ